MIHCHICHRQLKRMQEYGLSERDEQGRYVHGQRPLCSRCVSRLISDLSYRVGYYQRRIPDRHGYEYCRPEVVERAKMMEDRLREMNDGIWGAYLEAQPTHESFDRLKSLSNDVKGQWMSGDAAVTAAADAANVASIIARQISTGTVVTRCPDCDGIDHDCTCGSDVPEDEC